MVRPLDNMLCLRFKRTLCFERTLLPLLVLVHFSCQVVGFLAWVIIVGLLQHQRHSLQKTPVVSVHQLFRTFRACLDITGSYLQNFLDGAKQLLANSIDQTVVPGSQGMTGYIEWIASSSWNADVLKSRI